MTVVQLLTILMYPLSTQETFVYATMKTEDGSSADLTAGQATTGISERVCRQLF